MLSSISSLLANQIYSYNDPIAPQKSLDSVKIDYFDKPKTPLINLIKTLNIAKALLRSNPDNPELLIYAEALSRELGLELDKNVFGGKFDEWFKKHEKEPKAKIFNLTRLWLKDRFGPSDKALDYANSLIYSKTDLFKKLTESDKKILLLIAAESLYSFATNRCLTGESPSCEDGYLEKSKEFLSRAAGIKIGSGEFEKYIQYLIYLTFGRVYRNEYTNKKQNKYANIASVYLQKALFIRPKSIIPCGDWAEMLQNNAIDKKLPKVCPKEYSVPPQILRDITRCSKIGTGALQHQA